MNLFRWRQRQDAELDAEIRSHLDEAICDRIARGETPDEARANALREFGNVGLVKEVTREIWGWASLERLGQDLRFGLRMLRKNPGFSLIAILTLALGIGANTAIFSLINATFWQMLPVKDPQQLALFSLNRQGQTDYDFSYPFFARLREQSQSFSGLVAASSTRPVRLQTQRTGEAVETAQQERVTGNYFSVLGVNAVLGRTLNETDDSAANPQAVVVLSYDFWQRRFGLDPAVIGRKVLLDDFPFTVIGIAPPGFTGLEVGRRADLWWPVRAIPLVSPNSPALRDEGNTWLKMLGRLQPGASLTQAHAEMEVLFKQHMAEVIARQSSLWADQRRELETLHLELTTGSTGWTSLRQQFKKPLLLLMMVVGLVLLIACANVANLLLARASVRRKEIAVRLALGAGRFRLIRQLLTESLLLAGLGGVAGLIFARWATNVLVGYLPQQIPLTLELRPDARVLGFTLAVSSLTGLLFGLAPALQATRLELVSSLKDQAGGSIRKLRLPLHKSLIIAQVALSLFLLVGAGLFVRSLQNLQTIDLGFERDNLSQFRLDTGKGYNATQRAGLYQQMLAKLEAMPGVRTASFSSFSLLSGNRARGKVSVPGFVARGDDEALCNTLSVGPNYFAAMGMSLVAGRDFKLQDARPGAPNTEAPSAAVRPGPPAQTPAEQVPLVAVINQAMARHFFGDENPIGHRFSVERDAQPGPPIEIVGVVKDAKYSSVRERVPRTFYLAWLQQPGNSDQTFQLRTMGAVASLATAIRRTAQELDPKLQIVGLATMNERVNESLLPERLIAQLAGFFSLCALLLACIGLYGVMSYAVTRRTQEIGIRMALGANVRDVVRLVMSEMLLLVGLGIGIGLSVALATTRLVASLLFGLTPSDPFTITIATLLLLGVAALAGYIPARRAAKVDPLVALHYE